MRTLLILIPGPPARHSSTAGLLLPVTPTVWKYMPAYPPLGAPNETWSSVLPPKLRAQSTPPAPASIKSALAVIHHFPAGRGRVATVPKNPAFTFVLVA